MLNRDLGGSRSIHLVTGLTLAPSFQLARGLPVQRQNPISIQRMLLTESLTINAILIGLLSSRERSSLIFVERGQTCTGNGFNGDLESLSSLRFPASHGPQSYDQYQTRYLKRPPSYMHRLHTAIFVVA